MKIRVDATTAAAGNMKLPFYAFSSLPGFDCPGAGACLYGDNEYTPENFGKGWCYSFTGWLYPAAFFRQLQNSLLLRSSAGLNALLIQTRNALIF